ncbi:hypothetical protein AAG906_007473 [Vitis piasezkii]
MKAQKSIEVTCLSSEAAWTLFQKEVGEETLKSHPHIPRLAKIVAEECKGLPLALITLGRAMAGEKDPSNWDKVIQDLSKFPAEISDGECGKKRNKILVYNDVSRLKEAQEIPNLKAAEKMSLWDENVKKFPKTLVTINTNVLSRVEESLLDELESLNGISEICITICTTRSFNKLKSSHKLQRCISQFELDKCGDMISLELLPSFLKRMKHLRWLCISDCNELKDIKIEGEGEGTQRDATLQNYNAARGNYFRALHGVYIHHCSKLLNITWLVCAPYLEELTIEDCESIEQVICYGVEEKLDIFSRLKYLKLNNLPRLKSIYHHPLPFSSLEIIKVYDCKSLRSLPFDSNTSNNNLKKIKGETSWWNQLEWNDETIKHSFTPYFQIHEAEAYLTDSEESETDGIDEMQEDSTSN